MIKKLQHLGFFNGYDNVFSVLHHSSALNVVLHCLPPTLSFKKNTSPCSKSLDRSDLFAWTPLSLQKPEKSSLKLIHGMNVPKHYLHGRFDARENNVSVPSNNGRLIVQTPYRWRRISSPVRAIWPYSRSHFFVCVLMHTRNPDL